MPSGVKDIQLLELKDTISQLNKTISTQNELISSLQKMLEERNAKDSEKDLLIANLQSQLAYLKNKVFGSTSEIRHDQLDGQLNLFGTPVGDEKPAEVIEPEVISVKGYTKERKPKATYDDKYNSVRSICKHFFTDIVGLSIKFFCVSLRHMSIGTGVVVAVAFQQVDSSPDAETGTQCDDEGLKNGYCAVEKCHKCVPPCTMRPYGLMNSDFPSACAPANGQTYSQISNPNQKPGYVKRRQLAAPSYSVANSTPMTSSSPERTYLA